MADFPRNIRGASVIEVLVSLGVVTVGLLGIIGTLGGAQRAEFESYQRAQAIMLMNDMVGRINSNRKAAQCYVITTDAANGSPWLGTSSTVAPACSAWGIAVTQARAVQDLNDWQASLLGAAEQKSGNAVGAMLDARGCVTYDAVNDVYQVSVAWQGTNDTVAPTGVDATLTCGLNQYSAETRRRVVSTTLRIANLN